MKQSESTLDVHNSSKRHKNNTFDSVDRISALPDSILGLILSLLPTKNAVATAFLSKRWKFVWLTVSSLDFYHEGCSKELAEDEDIKFLQFVNRVLHLHDVGALNKFRFVWNPRYISSSHVSSWITNAITKNVHELSLCVETPNGPFDIPELFVMPITVFSCCSLQSLELNGGISVSEAIVDCLPRLESLKLVLVVFQSEETFEKLISGCPMLNYLHLQADAASIRKSSRNGVDFTYRISSTSLTRLELCHELYVNDDLAYCRLKLEAPSLEYLKLGGFIYEFFMQKSLSSLVEFDFRIGESKDLFVEDCCDTILEAVEAFDCAKSLTLSGDVMWALSGWTTRLLLEFKRLVKLETSIECCQWSLLLEFIQCSDSLEVLTVHQNSDHHIDESDHVHSIWTAPVEVPRCLSNSLKKVVIDGYCGYEDEREMIRYLLQHGSVLEVMEIHCDRFLVGQDTL